MGTLMQDMQFCLRTLRKTPGFTVVVILTLALGIGANTAIFSIVDGVLLRPLPFPEPERLVNIVDNAPGAGLYDFGMSEPELRDLQERSGIFDGVSAVWPVDANITGGAQPERVELVVVSANYFSLLGVHAQIGRILGPQDQAEGFAETALISNAFWRRAFGSDPNVLGRRIRLDGDAYTIVGVTPADFPASRKNPRHRYRHLGHGGLRGDPFQAAGARRAPYHRRDRTAARRACRSKRRRLAWIVLLRNYAHSIRTTTDRARFTIQLEPLKDSLTGNVRPMLLTLMGAVAMMLLIGCANVANLLLVRAAGRQREIALRQSLGATRARLARQMLTESVLLAIAAGIVGIAAAAWSLRVLLFLVPSNLPRLAEITIDARVLIFRWVYRCSPACCSALRRRSNFPASIWQLFERSSARSERQPAAESRQLCAGHGRVRDLSDPDDRRGIAGAQFLEARGNRSGIQSAKRNGGADLASRAR